MSKSTAEYLEIMRAAEDDLTELRARMVGCGWVRLEVPFHSIAALKKWRDLMKGFIAEVDWYCQPREPGMPYIDEVARLSHLRTSAVIINRNMRGHKGPGRPKGAKTKRYSQADDTVDNVTKIK